MRNWRPRYWIPVADTFRVIVAIVLAIIIILLLLRACNTVAPTLVGPSASTPVVTGQPIDLSGTAAPNAVVRVFDGDTLIGETKADANGNWKLALSTGLGVGAHDLTARVFRDNTQIAGSAPLSLSIAALPATPIPTAAPTPTLPPVPTAPPPTEAPRPTPTLVAPAINNPIAGAVLTADKPGDVVGIAAPGSKVQIMDGDKLLAEVTADSNGKWSFGLPSSLPAGTHVLKSVVLDASGKEAARSPAVSVEIKSVEAPTILPIVNGQLSIGSVVKG